jgi:hypothetical protein
MATFGIPFELEKAIARAIGVDHTQVSRILIDVNTGHAPRFRVTGWLTVDQADALVRVFEATSFDEKVAQ